MRTGWFVAFRAALRSLKHHQQMLLLHHHIQQQQQQQQLKDYFFGRKVQHIRFKRTESLEIERADSPRYVRFRLSLLDETSYQLSDCSQPI